MWCAVALTGSTCDYVSFLSSHNLMQIVITTVAIEMRINLFVVITATDATCQGHCQYSHRLRQIPHPHYPSWPRALRLALSSAVRWVILMAGVSLPEAMFLRRSNIREWLDVSGHLSRTANLCKFSVRDKCRTIHLQLHGRHGAIEYTNNRRECTDQEHPAYYSV